MKKTLITILSIATSQFIFAQTSITSQESIFKIADTTVNYSVDRNQSDFYLYVENNFNLDFSQSVLLDSAYSYVFVPNENTEGFNRFPTANLAVTGLVFNSETQSLESYSSYSFNVKSTDGQVENLGSYSTIDKREFRPVYSNSPKLVFPIKVGDEFTGGLSKDTGSLDNTHYLSSVSSDEHLVYMAYGKVKFPNTDKFVDCYALYSSSVNNDTLEFWDQFNPYYKSIYYQKIKNEDLTFVEVDGYKSISFSKDSTYFGSEFDQSLTVDSSISYSKKAYTKDIINAGNTTGVKDISIANLSIYPNPTSDYINVLNGDEIRLVRIFDTKGKLYNQTAAKQMIEMPKQNGIYIVQLVSKSGKTYYKKIVKE